MATAWAAPDAVYLTHGARTMQGIEATGTDAGPPATATDGISVRGLCMIWVFIKNTSGLAFAAGTLQAWVYNPIAALWCRAPGMDQTVTTLAAGAGQGYPVIQLGNGLVPIDLFTQIAFLPNGLGRSSQIDLCGG